MQKNIKRMFIGFTAVLATAAIFSVTIKDSSLNSLRANAVASAGTKCVQATNSDCKSPSTGNIYTGYKAQTIGQE